MKQTLKRIIRTVKSVKGNSLAEFATTTALMATLAATAAPKLSEMSEGAKAEKSRNELDKMVKQAGQFYQDTADIEGRGRFPGQDKFNLPVTGAASSYTNNTAVHTNHVSNSTTHERKILLDLGLAAALVGLTSYCAPFLRRSVADGVTQTDVRQAQLVDRMWDNLAHGINRDVEIKLGGNPRALRTLTGKRV